MTLCALSFLRVGVPAANKPGMLLVCECLVSGLWCECLLWGLGDVCVCVLSLCLSVCECLVEVTSMPKEVCQQGSTIHRSRDRPLLHLLVYARASECVWGNVDKWDKKIVLLGQHTSTCSLQQKYVCVIQNNNKNPQFQPQLISKNKN